MRVVNNDEEKRREHKLWDASKPSLWLCIGSDKQYTSGMSVYFSLNKKKQSKQLATLLSQNISQMTDISVNGTFFEWKNTMNSIIPLTGSAPSIPTVQLASNNYLQMNERQIEDFTYCMTRTLTAYYHQSFLIDVIQYFLFFQHAPTPVEPQQTVHAATIHAPKEEALKVPMAHAEPDQVAQDMEMHALGHDE
ncbi:hypothetical protein, partial [Neobacillus drentensis]|uniref:hypothetical protein n=1 Tax=Neobacillus drentensis TaxID=220684 RepID=UPI0030023CDB